MDVSTPSLPESDHQSLNAVAAAATTTTTAGATTAISTQINPQLQQEQMQMQQEQAHIQQTLQYPQHQIPDYYYQAQLQSYDQSYYSYYSQYPYQNHWQYDQQTQQHYAYYQPDYSAAYQQQPIYYQHDSASGVSAPQEAQPAVDYGGSGASLQVVQQQQQQQIQSVYSQPQTSVNAVVPHPPGMNPAAAAAIAALEQLTRFAGTMDAAERAMAGLSAKNPGFGSVLLQSPVIPHPHRGGGSRRGGGQFQGSGRGNVAHHHGSIPPSRGRGHGRGKARSRRFQSQGAASTSSYPEPSAAQEHSADAVEKATQSASASETVASNSRPVQIAWCELCRVDCTSLEILEQHKNGKRHKKNMLRIEELKNAIKPGEEIQINQEPVNISKPEEPQQPQIAQNGEVQNAVENIPSEAASVDLGVGNDLQNNSGERPEVPVVQSSDQQGKKLRMNVFDDRKRGMKRKMKGGRGGKRMKTRDTNRRPVEPPKPKVVAPLICNLCNVKCDTREVLDRHFSGKKHIAKLKRFEGHQALYGPMGLQALYPPNPVAQTHPLPHGHQPFYGHQGPGPFPPQGGYFPSQAHQFASTTAGLNPQFLQSSMPQQLEPTLTFEANPANAV